MDVKHDKSTDEWVITIRNISIRLTLEEFVDLLELLITKGIEVYPNLWRQAGESMPDEIKESTTRRKPGKGVRKGVIPKRPSKKKRGEVDDG